MGKDCIEKKISDQLKTIQKELGASNKDIEALRRILELPKENT